MLQIQRHKHSVNDGELTRTPDVFDWLEGTLPASMSWFSRPWTPLMRLEDKLEQDKYIVRAELPGVDPDKDVEITVADGVLTISAERREEMTDKDHSEFRYGSLMRRVTLPTGAQVENLKADYSDGILEVVVPVKAAPDTTRRIPVTRGKSA